MQADKRRLALLNRQCRIKAIERKLAVRSLSEALAEQARMQDIARRSRDMASNRKAQLNAAAGDELRQLITFSATMRALSRDADRASGTAENQAQIARQDITRIDSTLERLAEKTRTTHRRVETRQHIARASAQPVLARNLLRKQGDPTQLSDEGGTR